MIVLKMRKKINWLLCFIAVFFTASCNNSAVEDINALENELTNLNSSQSLSSQLRQIYSGPAISARTSMFDSQEKKRNVSSLFILFLLFFLMDLKLQSTMRRTGMN